MAQVRVRPAIAGDGLAIATVQLEVWQTAFGAMLPSELLRTPPAELATAWTSVIGADDQLLMVAEEGPTVTGFVQAGLLPAEAALPARGEIKVLYVRPAWARRGHGGRLIAGAAAALGRGDAMVGEWWIPETDTASSRFARSLGWVEGTSTRAFETGRALIRERRWTGTLDLPLSAPG